MQRTTGVVVAKVIGILEGTAVILVLKQIYNQNYCMQIRNNADIRYDTVFFTCIF